LTKNIISCPKCGFEQERSEECVRCGIVFSKFNKKTSPVPKTSADPIMIKRKTPTKAPSISFRALRITILLFLLTLVGMNAWLTKLRTTDWDQPLRVVVYPINGDGSATSSEYIDFLDLYAFESIADFMQQESERYGLELNNPFDITLAPQIDELPPIPPRNGNKLGIILWSLKIRYWSYISDTYEGPTSDAQMFVLYFNPEVHKELEHSLGLEKGLIGVVNAFSGRGMEAGNNVIIAHEILHTLGATDKYDLATNQPVYPEGYAEPERQPLYPQEKAEIMACTIPLSKTKADMPEDLIHTVIGEKTAREIRWIK
jgi:hypothetical protein